MTDPYQKIGGEMMLVAAAKVPSRGPFPVQEGQLAIRTSDLKQLMQRNQATAIVQLYKLVIPGLVLTKHIFQGLNRPLFCDGKPDGDKAKLIYTRRPGLDFYATPKAGIAHDYDAVRKPAPLGRTFAVIVSPIQDQHREDYPDIDGWIEHWYWTAADARLPDAPVDWIDRYGKKIWTEG